MGNCITSMMDKNGQKDLIEHPIFSRRLTYGNMNVKISEDEETCSGIYRCSDISEETHRKYMDETYHQPNIMQQMEKICKEKPGVKAMAYRTVEKVTTEIVKDADGKKKDWEYYHMSTPVYFTNKQLWENILSIGRGIVEAGVKVGSKVALYADTRWEWITTVYGLWTQGIQVVTVYANLGLDALAFALKEAECDAIVCAGNSVNNLIQILSEDEQLQKVLVVYLDELPADCDTKEFRIVSWQSVYESGRKSQLPHTIPQSPDEEVLIMYTSGTTGRPKGVVHSIGALTQAAYFLHSLIIVNIGRKPDDTYLSFLPSAHIFEFICENIMLLNGIMLCFGTPRTLTDISCKPQGDLNTFTPFFFIAVPRILETIKKGVEAKLPPPGSLKRRIFDLAYMRRRDALLAGKDTPYWNKKVFKVPHKLLGGKVRAICCGGAPLADLTQEWVAVVLGMPVAQGYGMTESVTNATVQFTGELRCLAGQVIRGVEMKLLDTDVYKHTDKPNPRGEVLIRGNVVFKRYYKQEEETQKVLVEDGWLRTGDVGEILTDNDMELAIIGRVKALAKNQLGEYIALEQMEAIYGQHPVCVANGVCVLVDSQRTYITALMLTDEPKAMQWAKDHNISGTWPSIVDNAAFEKSVLQAAQKIARDDKRQEFEVIKAVKVLADEWTPENGLTTASMKVRRSVIDEHYATVIAKLFEPEKR